MTLLYSALIFFGALLGGITPLVLPIQENGLKLFISLGAGILIGMSFLHLIPEAAELLPHQFGIWLVFGFLVLLILERFIMVHPCEEGACDYHTIGLAAFFGLAVHGIIEGFALASSLLYTDFGYYVLIAILAHKFPQGVALSSIMKMAHKSNFQITLFAVGVALCGPLGMGLAYFFLSNLPSSAGILLSISAGTFLYIGACDLLPELHRASSEKFKRLIVFLVGLSTGFLVNLSHSP